MQLFKGARVLSMDAAMGGAVETAHLQVVYGLPGMRNHPWHVLRFAVLHRAPPSNAILHRVAPKLPRSTSIGRSHAQDSCALVATPLLCTMEHLTPGFWQDHAFCSSGHPFLRMRAE